MLPVEAERATTPRTGLSRASRERRLSHQGLQVLERAGLPILMGAMFVFFALYGSTGAVFTSSANLKVIFGNQAVTALVALAMVVPLSSGYFDLSVGAVTGLTSIAVAATIGPHHWPIVLGLAFGLGLGAFIGFINGFLVAKVRLNGFVVTLGTYTLLLGLAQAYTGGTPITLGIPLSFGTWGTGTVAGLPNPFILLLVIALLVWYMLTNTPFGRHLEAIGSNETAARLVGINTDRVVWTSFVLSGTLAAAAGALQTAQSASGDPAVGTAFLFPALAAVFLGATTIKPGRYNVWGTLVGVYFIAMSVSGLTLLGANTWISPVFNGASLVIAVALSTLIGRRRAALVARGSLAIGREAAETEP